MFGEMFVAVVGHDDGVLDPDVAGPCS